MEAISLYPGTGPASGQKKRGLLAKIKALPARTALLAEDETDLLLFPPLRSGWSRRSEEASVLISGYNARRTFFGALHLRSGNMVLLDQARKRTVEFLEFLDLVAWHYRGFPVAMLLDENSTHTSEESRSLAEDLDIQLMYLPVRSPHLNPLDQIWREGKQTVCANWQQTSIEDQVDYFKGYYQGLSPRERLVKAGMFSPNYWLFSLSR